VFAQPEAECPASASKVGWDRVPGSIVGVDPEVTRQAGRFLAFFDEIVSAGEETYVADKGSPPGSRPAFGGRP